MEQLRKKAEILGISLTEQQCLQFQKYYEYLIEKNKVMNLTGITEKEEVIDKHFIDSLGLAAKMDLTKPLTVLDLGTGAGFPGIPLKIAFPNLTITLLDSLNKRIKFLDEVIDLLGLTGIETIHGRAEDYAKPGKLREQFDLCVSRAVANLSSLSEYCIPYVKEGGYFIPYKSGNIDEELKKAGHAIGMLGGKVESVEEFQIPGTDIERTFVKIKKRKATPKRFPRKAGMPSKDPL
ncbi:16S rRNA (guanine(527)-N(7))-methyltransferase [Anaerostipes sp. 992a]|uniref:16S rRNA (guanine(527)-N(7))-methyltransferase RsmG n=1 Tax=Anaerostipes sp. 992a TaxID=1261637 RepID=UPI0009527E00|nr:16S rRNA (guanine(527)-N(7))-methyltransferase RsmG [Anaerostipes sp. 992a]MDD5968394.1 16S rRNA (guanine(527)-N(7))-methyltransferase RsmG [Anaerostipes sp.]OLR63241.1 16S rRNA (guanine(527)-N(7))-methyltransferase [Anaerostipes sp. 992a]